MNDHKDRLYKDIGKLAKSGKPIDAAKKIGLLLQQRSELLKVLRFLIDLYCDECFWDRSIDSTQRVVNTIDSILSMNKRRLMNNSDFQEEFAILCCACMSQNSAFHDKAKYIRICYDTRRLENKLENVLVCREAYPECKIVAKYFRGKMTVETLQLFNTLYHFMRKEDKKTSLYMLVYLYQYKDISFDRVPLSHELFDDLKDDQTCDISWYIWWFLIEYVELMRVRDERRAMHWEYASRLLDVNFRLYKCLYMKRHRENRVSILQCMLFGIMSSKALDVTLCELNNVKLLQNVLFENCIPDNVVPVPKKQKEIEHNDVVHATKKNDFGFLNCVIYNDIEESRA